MYGHSRSEGQSTNTSKYSVRDTLGTPNFGAAIPRRCARGVENPQLARLVVLAAWVPRPCRWLNDGGCFTTTRSWRAWKRDDDGRAQRARVRLALHHYRALHISVWRRRRQQHRLVTSLLVFSLRRARRACGHSMPCGWRPIQMVL
jgi:hypothetical protein